MENIYLETVEGKIVATAKLENDLENLKSAKENLTEYESNLRQKLLLEMTNMNCSKIKTDKFSVSKITPKPTYEYDVDKIISELPTEVLSEFLIVTENKSFDIERFITEQKEMYDKYTNTTITKSLDIEKMKKFPQLYEKYVTEKLNDKSSLRIK